MKNKLPILLLTACLGAAQLCVASKTAFADDEDGGKKGDDHGDDDHGGGDDDDGENNGGGASAGGNQNNNANSRANESDRIRDAVRSGQAVSMRKLLNFIGETYRGRVINVNLKEQNSAYVYEVKLLTIDNKLRTLSLDALKLTDPNTASIY
jgi:uncharacterized membrane protein YkoI